MYIHIKDILGKDTPWACYKIRGAYLYFDKTRTKLCIQLASNDEDGNPISKYYQFRDGIRKEGRRFYDDYDSLVAIVCD